MGGMVLRSTDGKLCGPLSLLLGEGSDKDPRTPVWPWTGNSCAVAQDAFQRDQPIAFGRTRNLPVDEIQPAGRRICFHRAVPVVIGKVHQVGHQFGILLGRKPGDRFLDFDNRAHNFKLAEKAVGTRRGALGARWGGIRHAANGAAVVAGGEGGKDEEPSEARQREAKPRANQETAESARRVAAWRPTD